VRRVRLDDLAAVRGVLVPAAEAKGTGPFPVGAVAA